jgi:hypothetical protein
MDFTKLIHEYADENGALQVWKSWRDTMLSQNRNVDEKFMSLPIPTCDMELDSQIAFDVVDDFLMWAISHEGYRLVKDENTK